MGGPFHCDVVPEHGRMLPSILVSLMVQPDLPLGDPTPAPGAANQLGSGLGLGLELG